MKTFHLIFHNSIKKSNCRSNIEKRKRKKEKDRQIERKRGAERQKRYHISQIICCPVMRKI